MADRLFVVPAQDADVVDLVDLIELDGLDVLELVQPAQEMQGRIVVAGKQPLGQIHGVQLQPAPVVGQRAQQQLALGLGGLSDPSNLVRAGQVETAVHLLESVCGNDSDDLGDPPEGTVSQ